MVSEGPRSLVMATEHPPPAAKFAVCCHRHDGGSCARSLGSVIFWQGHCLVQTPRSSAERAEQNETAEKIFNFSQGRALGVSGRCVAWKARSDGAAHAGSKADIKFSVISAFSAISALKAGVGSAPAEAASPASRQTLQAGLASPEMPASPRKSPRHLAACEPVRSDFFVCELTTEGKHSTRLPKSCNAVAAGSVPDGPGSRPGMTKRGSPGITRTRNPGAFRPIVLTPRWLDPTKESR
jgi:hypothetical protein